MSQHDLDIANASGSAVRSDLNLALKALGSTSKGSSAPGTLQTGQLWIDDSGTPWILKVYDGAQHITVGTINASTNVFAYSGSGAGLTAGTTPLTAFDIDGGTDIGADLTTSDLIVVDDGAGGTNRKAALSRINTLVQAAGGFPLTALDIDGGTDIGEAIVDADLLIVDNGAGGTNRKTTASRLKTYIGGGPTQANQAAIEGETNENTYIPPDLLKHNPGVAKGWVVYNQSANSILASHNVSSITDTAAGQFDVLWNTDFSSANFAVALSVRYNSPNAQENNYASGGGTRVYTVGDYTRNYVIAFGDQ